MVLDQQIPLEWAFQGPYTLRDRLGRDYDATALAEMEPDELTKLFAARPALHRYPRQWPSGCRNSPVTWSSSTTARPRTSGTPPLPGSSCAGGSRRSPASAPRRPGSSSRCWASSSASGQPVGRKPQAISASRARSCRWPTSATPTPSPGCGRSSRPRKPRPRTRPPRPRSKPEPTPAPAPADLRPAATVRAVQIRVNGDTMAVPDGETVAGLLADLGLG